MQARSADERPGVAARGAGRVCFTVLCRAGKRRALYLVSFDDPEEQDWALRTWRSLDHAVAA